MSSSATGVARGPGSPLWRDARLMMRFFGSMNLAITLLVVIAIASVIGTIILQNEPYTAYIEKFGPFWHPVFATLGLYDVYSAGWFLALMAFLVLSVLVCVTRNAPAMLKELRQWRSEVTERSLEGYRQTRLWHSQDADALRDTTKRLMALRHYRTREHQRDDGAIMIVARKGTWNRLGYLFAHLSIVVICLGGLLDSRLGLKLASWVGDLRIETRNLPVSQVPPESFVPLWNPSFRGNVNIPEGQSADVAFLALADGYVVQPLPFQIEVEDFHTEHNVNGTPKSFRSDLVIHDETLAEPLRQRISVNSPLIHRGYAIYQSDFSDGGSALSLTLWPLQGGEAVEIETEVFAELALEDYPQRLEMDDFRLFNINPVLQDDGETEQKNFGPSITFRVRAPTGEAVEYINYLAPVVIDDFASILSGMRRSLADEHAYLYIPADAQGSTTLFMRLVAALRAPVTRDAALAQTVNTLTANRDEQGQALRDSLSQSISALLAQFLDQGLDDISVRVQEIAADGEQGAMLDAYLRMLQLVVASAYGQLIDESPHKAVEDEAMWLEKAFLALNGVAEYGSPFYVQLRGFTHIQATGLQIAKAPGTYLVYLGSFLLCLGVFMMFYVHQRRLWVLVTPQEHEGQMSYRVRCAGSDVRRSKAFEQEFQAIAGALARATGDPK